MSMKLCFRYLENVHQQLYHPLKYRVQIYTFPLNLVSTKQIDWQAAPFW